MNNKKLRITEDAYNILVSSKNPEENFSEYILRTFGKNSKRNKEFFSG